MAKTTKTDQTKARPTRKKVARKKKTTTKKKVAVRKKAAPKKKVAAKKKASPKKKAVAKQVVTHKLAEPRGADRRTEERHDIDRRPKVEVTLHGYHRDAREFGIGAAPDTRRKIQTDGTTVNLSLGGMLAHIADPITEGSHCLIRFLNAGASVRPELRWGLIIRCTKIDDGGYEVAVGFDSPLEVLDIDGLAA